MSNTNNSIKPFKMYRVQVGTSFNMVGHTRFLMSHDCTHLNDEVWCLFGDVMITDAIKTEYTITSGTYLNINSCYLLHSPHQLNFNEVDSIYKEISVMQSRIYTMCGREFSLNLLELLMVNWEEWSE